ncbi:tail fiber protein [Photorhabdus namnaonensis]|uniref:Phage tail fiber repeat protein n=1 Tax=Photorhabdus namnaonensis TaxID=1851568 RepID=A0A1B8YCF0_9GAMM|nr:tail fiber protein [Photorhabdus namnaonensis]OCA52813.1 Phage tail fiber repeat protein [Photorhabdus namnaonensis]
MSTKNDFKAFSISNNANVISQERYEQDQSLKTGFPPENITTHLLNKVLRQSSTVSSVIADFIATQSGNDVLDDGDIAKLTTQLNRALEQKITTKVPSASLTQQGVIQLTDQTGNSNTLAATQKLVSDINQNANNRLAKDQNGADIPDKNTFVKNLGLIETIINAQYPVGIVIWFAQNKNPNVLFPGTAWEYIGENKTVRLASTDGSDLLSTGGSDSISLTTAQMPAHNHAFSGTTSTFDYGTKTTNTTGAHHHDSGWGEAWGGRYGYYDDSRNNIGSSTVPDNDNYKYNTSTDGAHSHTVSIGSHNHTISGNTGDSGSNAAISITNSYIKLMGWYRKA